VEGWKSVNTDPTNYSAHRFLADSYAARPRHEIARVSELLQSQLLQPTNITPIQPRLAESNLFLISAQGPGALSFNEFNPIFNRNGAAAQFSTLAGEHDTIGGEFVLSAIQNKLSWSLGYNKFRTDGWRQNADQDDQIADAFMQYELSYKTSIQAEYRYRETENGDLQLNFFEDNFDPTFNETENTNLIRLGFRHSFAPNSVLIGNFQYQNAEERDSQQQVGTVAFPPLGTTTSYTDLDSDIDTDDAYNVELSYLHRWQYLNLVGGAGYVNIDAKQEINVLTTFDPIVIPPPPPPPVLPPVVIPIPPVSPPSIKADRDVEHINGYLYNYIKPVNSLTVTIGGSYDDLDTDDDITKDRNQFNPKFGITWNPIANTTLRGAVFRTLKRTLITDQTLEPTQVAGFNQFFDDFNATEAWHYGGAIDQKFTDSIYAGTEYTYRNMSVPFNATTGGGTTLETTKWEEKIFRAYLFWTPYEWLALSADWLWERFERSENYADGAKTVETNYVPLGINFFHPSGLSASFTGTYVKQQGSFEGENIFGFKDGHDNFWLFDAAIRYRFPKRYGFFTVGVANLTDENFEYFETDRDNPRIQPDRYFFASITLAVP